MILRAGTQSGTAEVVAFSGSARTETPITIQIGGAAAAAVTMTANPAIVPWTGGTVTIAASLSDAAGHDRHDRSCVDGPEHECRRDGQRHGERHGGGRHQSRADHRGHADHGRADGGRNNGLQRGDVGGARRQPDQQRHRRLRSRRLGVAGSLTGTTSVSHIYSSAGTCQVIGTVVDSTVQGITSSAVVTVVAAISLSVNLTASPSPATEDQVVTFSATVSGSTVPIARFDWVFGDGTSPTTSGSSTNHVYTSSGTRTVTVTATTTEGVSGSTQITLIVLPLQVEILLTASPVNPSAGFPVTFTATVTPATVVVTRYDWLFGDGTPLLVNGGRTVVHAFAAAATSFTIKVTATLADGSTVETQTVVTTQ